MWAPTNGCENYQHQKPILATVVCACLLCDFSNVLWILFCIGISYIHMFIYICTPSWQQKQGSLTSRCIFSFKYPPFSAPFHPWSWVSRKPATARRTPLFVEPADQSRHSAVPLVSDQSSLRQHQMASGPWDPLDFVAPPNAVWFVHQYDAYMSMCHFCGTGVSQEIGIRWKYESN